MYKYMFSVVTVVGAVDKWITVRSPVFISKTGDNNSADKKMTGCGRNDENFSQSQKMEGQKSYHSLSTSIYPGYQQLVLIIKTREDNLYRINLLSDDINRIGKLFILPDLCIDLFYAVFDR